MNFKIRAFYSFFLIYFSLFAFGTLFGGVGVFPTQKLKVDDCLLPSDHPLQNKLKKLFKKENMFNSPQQLKRAGFQVLDRVHRGLMVAGHPSMNNYLIKKFQNKVSQDEQLENYLRRINGARALGNFIRSNDLKHIIVPQKWLYALPERFSDPKRKKKTYILIVEKMDLCSGGKDPEGEIAQKYYTIEFDILREICRVVYHFRGLDSMLHNLPFTYQNKIAFIDTERWERQREGYLRNIMPFLSEDRREYALSVFDELRMMHE